MSRDYKQELLEASKAISMAVLMMRMHMELMEAFLEEARDMDSFGHIVAPALFFDPERRAVGALMQPIFEGAVDFVKRHDAQVAKGQAALAKVGAGT